MTTLHRVRLGLLLVPLALVACANATSVGTAAGDASGGGAPGSSGISVPGSSGSAGPIDRDNPLDRIRKTCGVEYTVGEGPDASVGFTPCPSDQTPAPAGASPVQPTPGMADVRPRGWDTADVDAGGRRITISFVSGIEPCAVLDRVDVDYGAKAVTITLFEGHDPDAQDVACIDIGVSKEVVVGLREPIGDRTVRDGAP